MDPNADDGSAQPQRTSHETELFGGPQIFLPIESGNRSAVETEDEVGLRLESRGHPQRIFGKPDTQTQQILLEHGLRGYPRINLPEVANLRQSGR